MPKHANEPSMQYFLIVSCQYQGWEDWQHLLCSFFVSVTFCILEPVGNERCNLESKTSP